MKKLTYAEQLKHPNWQRKRLVVLEAAGWKCTSCSAADTTLHVHHKRYIKGRMAWEYDDAELVALCEGCHEADHSDREILDEILAKADHTAPVQAAISLLGGYFSGSYCLSGNLPGAAEAINSSIFLVGRLAAQLDIVALADIALLLRETHGYDESYWDPELKGLVADVERLSATLRALGDA